MRWKRSARSVSARTTDARCSRQPHPDQRTDRAGPPAKLMPPRSPLINRQGLQQRGFGAAFAAPEPLLQSTKAAVPAYLCGEGSGVATALVTAPAAGDVQLIVAELVAQPGDFRRPSHTV
jgi:hypothetical protein